MTTERKYKNADLLNRLSEMQRVPYYAVACQTLVQAEMAIVGLEQELEAAKAETDMWKATANATVDFDALRYRWLTRTGFKHADIGIGEWGEDATKYVECKTTFFLPAPTGIEFDEQLDAFTVVDIDAFIDAAMTAAGAAQKEQA